MPGANCSLPECSTSRTEKHKGISIFKIPRREGDFYKSWQKSILNVVTQYRVVDKSLKERIDNNNNIFICEKHFTIGDIEFTSKFFYFS